MWASIASVGFFLLSFFGRRLWPVGSASNPAAYVLSISPPWLWIGLVALYLRFAVARKMIQPTLTWICKNCSYTNGRHAVICEACKQPYAASKAKNVT